MKLSTVYIVVANAVRQYFQQMIADDPQALANLPAGTSPFKKKSFRKKCSTSAKSGSGTTKKTTVNKHHLLHHIELNGLSLMPILSLGL